MFVQVIEGRVGDRDGLQRQLDRWLEELTPAAVGWLGTTASVGAGRNAGRVASLMQADRSVDLRDPLLRSPG